MELRFDPPVPDGGYRWWYIDARSDDGSEGLALIAFVGSVFSPYYARARRRGPAAAENHCALNVALYHREHSRWSLTERGRHELQRDANHLRIGPSALHWRDGGLEIEIREVCVPWPSRLVGRVRISGPFRGDLCYPLDGAGRHHWGPIAPVCRAEVRFVAPGLHWHGTAYVDSNAGARPLEQDFQRWDWSRLAMPDGSVLLHYDVIRRDGGNTALGLRIDGQQAEAHALALRSSLPPGRWWRVARATRLPSRVVRVERTLEDTPFYVRSLLAGEFDGLPWHAIHESLDLDRFSASWVQCLLPFRMPRVAR